MITKPYFFSKDACDWTGTDEAEAKKILGGKGAALVKMARDGLNVPPGFTFTTDLCNLISQLTHDKLESNLDTLYAQIEMQAWLAMTRLEKIFGFTPLVAVRSGAPVSMPGMMDTILNVGLHHSNIEMWEGRIGKRAAWDSYRRLIQMLGSTAFDVPHEVFEFQLAAVKKAWKCKEDSDLCAAALGELVVKYLDVFEKATGSPFPQDPKVQLMAAIKAVFNSWMNPRAIEYRKLNKIDPGMGTACNIQAMVFGNMGEDSGTGVLFTRNPSTGDAEIMGEFLQDAQGEDVVAGIRTPVDLKKMPALGGVWAEVHAEIVALCLQLEDSYKDMVDIEFTVQLGTLYVLQSRVGKRSAQAAFKIAHDLVQAGVITWEQAAKRLTRQQLTTVRRPSLDPTFKTKPAVVGLPACPGVVSGVPVFTVEDAVNSPVPCILVTHETTPDDIAGMNAAVGILTQTGGATSHAAVVARAMDKPCVVGCTDLKMTALKLEKDITITIDGSSGAVWLGVDVPVVDGSEAPAVRAFMDWAMNTSGAYQGSTVDLDEKTQHVVHASHWWGNTEVAEVVIEGLKAMKTRKNVVLDLRSPSFLSPDVDMLLQTCFGGASESSQFAFSTWMHKALAENAEALKGLRIMSPFSLGIGELEAVVVPVVRPEAAAYKALAA